MRVGFDTSVLHRPTPRGVVRATRGLVETLERRGRIDVVRLAPEPGENVRRWRQLRLHRAVRELALHGIHSPVSAFALLGRGRRVATIHELPWTRGVAENADAAHKLWARVGPLRVDAIITPSARTARLVCEESAPAAGRVHVASWGVDDIFTPIAAHDDELTLRRLSLAGAPFLLASGAVRAKKNPRASLAAMRFVAAHVRLVITGELTTHLLETLADFPEIAARVRLLGDVGDATLCCLTRHAQAVLVLSDSEGFGFPVVEAQASGTPVIAALDSTQAEIAGPAALLVNPSDPISVAAAIERAQIERNSLASAGFANAQAFTWDACAERIERVWESLA